MKKVFTWSVLIVCACAVSAFSQNKVVFDNQSGEPALVKLSGPTQRQVEVPNGANAETDATVGRYFIKVRYGTPGKYRYSKGEEFEVTETATTISETMITLHKVPAGNYGSEPISQEEFGKAGSTPVVTTGGGTTRGQAGPPSINTASNGMAIIHFTSEEVTSLAIKQAALKHMVSAYASVHPEAKNIQYSFFDSEPKCAIALKGLLAGYSPRILDSIRPTEDGVITMKGAKLPALKGVKFPPFRSYCIKKIDRISETQVKVEADVMLGTIFGGKDVVGSSIEYLELQLVDGQWKAPRSPSGL